LVAVGSHYHVVSVGSGLCLNVSSGSTKAGTAVIQWPCQASTSTNDQWSLVSEDGYYEIVSVSSGQCLNVDNNSQADSAPLIQWPCAPVVELEFRDSLARDPDRRRQSAERQFAAVVCLQSL
jgi:hypothetical protein